MQESPKISSKAWASLLWSQYNKLSEPLKEGFINLAQSLAEEVKNQNGNKKTQESQESDKYSQLL